MKFIHWGTISYPNSLGLIVLEFKIFPIFFYMYIMHIVEHSSRRILGSTPYLTFYFWREFLWIFLLRGKNKEYKCLMLMQIWFCHQLSLQYTNKILVYRVYRFWNCILGLWTCTFRWMWFRSILQILWHIFFNISMYFTIINVEHS